MCIRDRLHAVEKVGCSLHFQDQRRTFHEKNMHLLGIATPLEKVGCSLHFQDQRRTFHEKNTHLLGISTPLKTVDALRDCSVLGGGTRIGNNRLRTHSPFAIDYAAKKKSHTNKYFAPSKRGCTPAARHAEKKKQEICANGSVGSCAISERFANQCQNNHVPPKVYLV